MIDKVAENNQKALEVIKEKSGNNISEIIFVGSGSSYNFVMSSKGFVEMAANIRVCLETPQAFLYNHNVYHKGFVVGNDTVDDEDINIDIKSENFASLEIACVMQVICWLISQAKGVDLDVPFDPTETKYFNTYNDNDK